MLHEWTQTQITVFLYNKGNPRDAATYRPSAISTCMYGIIIKIILHRLKAPLTEALLVHKVCNRKDHTTLYRGLKVWSSALNMVAPYVVLLNVAEAYRNTLNPRPVGG